MEFVKYQHIERFGTEEVQNIEFGACYIFPKIDGTNGSVWKSNNDICAGSRNRELNFNDDNAGFYKSVINDSAIRNLLSAHPNLRLYGEWLVPHTLKTYRDEAWRKFYVFDVMDEQDNYLPYEKYAPILESFGVEFIRPLAIIKNPSYEQLVGLLETNTFLIKDGQGSGEGLVIKNYDYKNKFGRQIWAKIVRSEFKEKHNRTMGIKLTNGAKLIEEEIIQEFCTDALIEKVQAKIINEKGGWKSQYIPQLLNSVFHDIVKEESWNIVKKFKNPTINYKTLHFLCCNQIKEKKKEVFA